MKVLEEKILAEGRALNENVLKVDSFINHKVDPKLMHEIGKEFAEHFKDQGITKIVTIESSGIAPALMTAYEMNVLIIDDFLANGEAATGALRLLRKAHATTAGVGALIEKSFQPGREKLEAQGVHVYSLARISRLGKGIIEFVQE